MGGDDDAARNGGETAKGAEGTLSAYIRIRAIGRCRAAKWSDRLSLKSARGLRVCRPALALIRRQTRSERSGWPSAGVESVHRRTDHRGLGRAYNQGSLWTKRQGLPPLRVGGTWRLHSCADHRRESSGMALTGRKSKRRVRVDSGAKRSRQR